MRTETSRQGSTVPPHRAAARGKVFRPGHHYADVPSSRQPHLHRPARTSLRTASWPRPAIGRIAVPVTRVRPSVTPCRAVLTSGGRPHWRPEAARKRGNPRPRPQPGDLYTAQPRERHRSANAGSALCVAWFIARPFCPSRYVRYGAAARAVGAACSRRAVAAGPEPRAAGPPVPLTGIGVLAHQACEADVIFPEPGRASQRTCPLLPGDVDAGL